MSPPRQIGPFEIIKKLGAGTTASTYLAMERVGDTGAKLLVCLKVPHRALVRDRQFLKAFLGEAEIIAKLHHPNIVQLERVQRDQGLPYLVLDFVEGMDLAELISATSADNAQLDWLLVVYIAQAIARALEHAHEDQRGLRRAHDRPPVIHRDLAPSNVLLGLMSGSTYVTDFGLALAMDRAWILGSGQRGRIAYCAPEYLLGQPYDVRADLYSVGVILFEALTGQRPFPSAYMHQRNHHLDQVYRRARPPLHTLRYELHPSFGAPPPEGLVALARITDRLLEPALPDRFQTAAEVVDALGAIAVPSSMDRVLREVVERYQPAERRSIRTTTGEQSVANEWSATNPQHLERYLAHPGFDRERDRVRVTAEGAARLIAAFAHESNDSLADTLAAFEEAATDPDRPTFDPTDPDRPAFDAVAFNPPVGGAADLVSIIPSTRPSHPVATTASSSHAGAATLASGPGASVALASSPSLPSAALPNTGSGRTHIGVWVESSQPAPAQPPAHAAPASGAAIGAPAPAPHSPSFAETQYALPAFDPVEIERRTQRALRLAGLATVLAVVSLCAVSTASSLLAPLMTGHLGYHVIDGFWTPLFTYGGCAGLVLALILAAVAFALWRKDRAIRQKLSR